MDPHCFKESNKSIRKPAIFQIIVINNKKLMFITVDIAQKHMMHIYIEKSQAASS